MLLAVITAVLVYLVLASNWRYRTSGRSRQVLQWVVYPTLSLWLVQQAVGRVEGIAVPSVSWETALSLQLPAVHWPLAAVGIAAASLALLAMIGAAGEPKDLRQSLLEASGWD
jgi:hypothetical protein